MSKINPDKWKLNAYFDTAVCSMGVTFSFLCIAQIIHTMLDSQGVYFMGWFIPWSGPLVLVKLVMFLSQFYIVAGLTVCIIQVIFISLLFCFYVTIIYAVELKLGKRMDQYRFNKTLRCDSKHLQHVYRSFQVLYVYAIRIFGPLVMVYNAIFMAEVQYFSFILIRYWDNFEPFAKVPLLGGCFIIPSCWTLVLEFGKLLYKNGMGVIRSWKGRNWGSTR